MLTRLASAALGACLVLALAPAAVASQAGGPDDGPSGGVTCPPNSPVCVVTVKKPATPGNGSGTARNVARKQACSIPDDLLNAGQTVPCSDPDFGSWSNADGCYYTMASLQPPKSDPAWGGHTTGAIYDSTCFGTTGTGGGPVWRATAPAGGPGVTPEQLAQQAIKQLPIDGPDIGMAPGPGKEGLVGLPVWMWTDVTAATWGPATATAAVPGLSVTATAKASKIVWRMGDGDTVTCTGPGTPYSTSRGGASSPDCGHTYTAPSAGQTNDAYRVTATTTWDVTWVGGGATGRLTTTRASVTTARIGEMQVLIT